MRTWVAISFAGLGLLATVRAADPVCADACLTLATNYEYAGCTPEDELYYACRCASPEFLGTIAICIEDRCDHSEWNWIDVEICQDYGETAAIPSFQTVLTNASQHTTPPPGNLTGPLTNPITFSTDSFANAIATTSDFTNNMTDGSFFGWLCCMLAGLVCIIGAIQNHILPLFLRHHPLKTERDHKSSLSRWAAFIKRQFLLPATFGTGHLRRRFYLSIPLRSQTILISTYLAINLIFMCVGYHIFNENVYWPEEPAIQLTRYVADRSGILAFAQIPLLIAFAGRNNILIGLTGWSYSTFNVWHKWIARVCLIYTFIHSVAYTVYAFQEGGAAYLAVYYQDTYLRWGAVGTAACFVLCFQAIYFFRRFWYEIFLAVHIVMAIVFIVGCWYHVALLEFGHMEWLYAAIAIWAFDRFVRIMRLIVLNISWVKGRVARTAHLQVVSPDTIKAHVNVGYNLDFKPGQYVFVYFLYFDFWESHPFTVAAYEVDKETAQPKLTLLFRTHNGVTRKIQRYLDAGHQNVACLVEGPYGHHLPVEQYDNVLLLAGGVGITAILPYLRYLANLGTSRVRFEWVVRDEDSVNWFKEDIAAAAESPNVEVQIHVTKSGAGDVESARAHISIDLGAKRQEVGEISATSEGTASLARYFAVGHRPSLKAVVTRQTTESIGSLAVVACGPDTFVDETRQAVADNVIKAFGTLDYFEEAFTW